MEIEIKPDDIQTMLADAVLKSAIGNTIQEAIRVKLNDYTFKRAIEDTVGSIVRTIAVDMVRENVEVQAKIKEAVAAYMESEAMQKLVNKIGDSIKLDRY